MPAFPTNLSELALPWLEGALQRDFPSARLASFKTEPIGVDEGLMSELARLHLESKPEGTAIPGTLIAKFAGRKAASLEFAREMNLYGREIGFYRDIGDAAGIPVPKCYAIQFDQPSYQFVLLLEDLAPAESSDQIVGTAEAESRRVIKAFAKLHAKWWNNARLEEFEWARSMYNQRSAAEGLTILRKSNADAEQSGRFADYPEIKRLIPLLFPLFTMEPPLPVPFTLTHGDLRSDNVFFDTQSQAGPILIDWQLSGIGHPLMDIARWLTQSITIEARGKTEHAMLQLYHQELLRNGISNYSYKKLLQDYRLQLVIILIAFAMPMDQIDLSDNRTRLLIAAMYSRLDTALADWQVEKLLRTMPFILPFIKLAAWGKNICNRR